MLRSIPMIAALFQAVSVENLGEGQSILSFFKESGLSGKIVLAILLFFSFVSWIIIFAKFVRLRRVSRQSEKFVEFFRKSRRFSEVNTIASQLTETPLSTLFKAGTPSSTPRSRQTGRTIRGRRQAGSRRASVS